MDLQDKISNDFMKYLLEEQKKRDVALYPGAFAETSLIEHVYRYWLESVLAIIGFKNIRRELTYPNQTEGRGRKLACDISGAFQGKDYWLELKVAYSNTGYTNAELISDIEKLSILPKNQGKIYVVVFISSSTEPPKKLQTIVNEAKKSISHIKLAVERLPQPTDWDWQETSIQVLTILWDSDV